MKLTTKEKKELLKKHIGEKVYSYHGGYSEIMNTASEIRITVDTINKIARRNQCFLYENSKQLWYEGRQ